MESPLELKINLLEPKPRVRIPIILGLGFFLFALMVIMTVWFYTWQSRELSSQQTEKERLKTEIESYEQMFLVLKPIQEIEAAISIKNKEAATLAEIKMSYADIINEIDKVIPPEVTMVEIDIKPPRVVLTGFSPGHSVVARLLAGIKTSPRFTGVVLLTSEMKENSNEAQFTMEMEWEAEKR